MRYAELKLKSPALYRKINNNGGFLSLEDVDQVVEVSRLAQLLVRCGNGRFTCAAQDVRWFCEIIRRDGKDYVRDVSLIAD